MACNFFFLFNMSVILCSDGCFFPCFHPFRCNATKNNCNFQEMFDSHFTYFIFPVEIQKLIKIDNFSFFLDWFIKIIMFLGIDHQLFLLLLSLLVKTLAFLIQLLWNKIKRNRSVKVTDIPQVFLTCLYIFNKGSKLMCDAKSIKKFS